MLICVKQFCKIPKEDEEEGYASHVHIVNCMHHAVDINLSTAEVNNVLTRRNLLVQIQMHNWVCLVTPDFASAHPLY